MVHGGWSARTLCGADYMLTPAIFWRGEWEYIGFRDVKSAKVNINTLRTGLGVRF